MDAEEAEAEAATSLKDLDPVEGAMALPRVLAAQVWRIQDLVVVEQLAPQQGEMAALVFVA